MPLEPEHIALATDALRAARWLHLPLDRLPLTARRLRVFGGSTKGVRPELANSDGTLPFSDASR
jgi:hypothetical protein